MDGHAGEVSRARELDEVVRTVSGASSTARPTWIVPLSVSMKSSVENFGAMTSIDEYVDWS